MKIRSLYTTDLVFEEGEFGIDLDASINVVFEYEAPRGYQPPEEVEILTTHVIIGGKVVRNSLPQSIEAQIVARIHSQLAGEAEQARVDAMDSARQAA